MCISIHTKLQLYTNYANALEACGRKVAAMKFYRKVLEMNSKFGMAEGNIGRALQHYSALVHDSGHVAYLHHFAYNYLKDSLSKPDVHESAKRYFKWCMKTYGSYSFFINSESSKSSKQRRKQNNSRSNERSFSSVDSSVLSLLTVV